MPTTHSPRHSAGLLIFTDLDGTLLDHHTYSFDPALEALKEVERRGIPLVVCSSKTRAEVERTRCALNNRHPFIVENGGATFIPMDYFPFAYSCQRDVDGYHVIEYGTPYSRLVEILQAVRVESGAKIGGFSDLNAEQVAALTGLPMEEARLAKVREYDEPFFVKGPPGELDRVKTLFRRRGFRCTRGGRFHHLTGSNDKGKAVADVARLFERAYGQVRTVGIGDSQNDRPMLWAVDVPILVQRIDGKYDPAIKVPHLIRAGGIGPQGWCTAILDLLSARAEDGGTAPL